jgi:serine/threonine protein kinase
LTFDGPVLVDLGIAVSPEVTSFTATGTVVGSPAWMGPEQLAGEPVGAPADVWWWVAVAYYAATGRPPFGDGPLPALAYRIQHADVRVDGLPGWLRDKVVSGLAKDPDRRPTAASLTAGAVGPTGPLDPLTTTEAETAVQLGMTVSQPSA